ncbi:GNAT family N-acetyltransferase [Chitinophaga sp. Cy-1792]|uniref:GNAT family N-acetyltransferase n=1 Tax=Chitinophaga sp. Cy-1792 TaxID=2608339 RepID=UPI001420311E|nr:N-acetyltransferase [Chitinophaga sp. Cy-1792]NIG55594.1 N-acetyltransferase [Chitinophaga sp. Cy-1792]
MSTPNYNIRKETASDTHAIHEVTRKAFATAEHTSGTEQFIVNALRNNQQLTVSLVADAEGEIIGHVAISPVRVSSGDTGWYGLGPVSVLPEYQQHGIGSSLIKAALAILEVLDANGCVVLGDPFYYQRFGFETTPELAYPGVPAEYFQALAFKENTPAGIVSYDAAFEAVS